MLTFLHHVLKPSRVVERTIVPCLTLKARNNYILLYLNTKHKLLTKYSEVIDTTEKFTIITVNVNGTKRRAKISARVRLPIYL